MVCNLIFRNIPSLFHAMCVRVRSCVFVFFFSLFLVIFTRLSLFQSCDVLSQCLLVYRVYDAFVCKWYKNPSIISHLLLALFEMHSPMLMFNVYIYLWKCRYALNLFTLRTSQLSQCFCSGFSHSNFHWNLNRLKNAFSIWNKNCRKAWNLFHVLDEKENRSFTFLTSVIITSAIPYLPRILSWVNKAFANKEFSFTLNWLINRKPFMG